MLQKNLALRQEAVVKRQLLSNFLNVHRQVLSAFLKTSKIKNQKNKGIKNKDDLAELAIDELQEIIEISSDDASKMIMKAREHWFN